IGAYLPQDHKLSVIDRIQIDLPENSNLLYLDDIYFENHGESISVTRTLPTEDLGNKKASKRISPRYRTSSLDEQIKKLTKSEYDLVDIGIFEGETLENISCRLKKNGISVNKFRVGICNKNTVNRAGDKIYFKDTDIEVIVPEEGLFDFGEWIELRDLIGFDGRSVISEGRTYKCYASHLSKHATIPEENCDDVRAIADSYFNKLVNVVRRNNPGFSYLDRTVVQDGEEYILKTIQLGGNENE
ncbi:hypothetical protein GOV06_00030, partial [Candidatus Woesearchaeota archaeon]|nr:hypothetical protein [Candidatus Woesearchaeota archaeon]